MAQPFDIQRIRADFPILGRTVYGRPLVYLDSAATAQKPLRVVEKMSEFLLTSNGNVHRGAHRLSDEATAAYEAARQRVASFIGASDPAEVIFTSGATASLNTAAHSLMQLLVNQGDNIIVSEMEHHANIVPWQVASRDKHASAALRSSPNSSCTPQYTADSAPSQALHSRTSDAKRVDALPDHRFDDKSNIGSKDTSDAKRVESTPSAGPDLTQNLRHPSPPPGGAARISQKSEIQSGNSVEIRVLPFNDAGELEVEKLESLIDGRTKILAITQCSNVLGTRPDIKKAAEIAHKYGIVVVVDGCQGVVHGGGKRLNVNDLGADIYAFSGHKLYGPTGIGVMWGRRELLEKMPPFLAGGDMVDRVTFEGTTFAQLPFKFEAGTTNFTGAVGLAEAIDYISQFDPQDVENHEVALLQKATQELRKIDGLRIYGTTKNKAPIVSFTVDGAHPADIGAILDKQGVAIRTGTHCAQPLMAHFGLTGMCRASFAIYNTMEEVEIFVAALRKAVAMLRG